MVQKIKFFWDFLFINKYPKLGKFSSKQEFLPFNTGSAMLIFLKIALIIGSYVLLFFLILRHRRRFMLSTGSQGNQQDGGPNNSDGDGGDSSPDDTPVLDLPPGVYILPPGAPDPSQYRKEGINS